jgi:uncharacterized repeat protein (TIGR01451 family)
MRALMRIVRARSGVVAAGGLSALVASALLVSLGGGTGAAAAAGGDPADLSLTISDSPDPVATGAALTYAIKVHNGGPDPATDTIVTDGLPGAVQYASATVPSGSCGHTGSKVVCDLDTVTTTVDRTITLRVTVKKKSGEFTNSASVSSGISDPNPANNLDSELTKVSNPKAPKLPTCAARTVTIFGTPGPDRLVGTGGDDVIFAEAGDDLVYGFRGGDVICTGPGTDLVRAGGGSDAVFGGGGADYIRGRRGDDGLHGGHGHDRLRGRAGDDLVSGGRGFDRCRGGAGLDALRGCER